jgi:hypothetical protein
VCRAPLEFRVAAQQLLHLNVDDFLLPAHPLLLLAFDETYHALAVEEILLLLRVLTCFFRLSSSFSRRSASVLSEVI